MNPIGFKVTDNNLACVEESANAFESISPQHLEAAEQLIRARGRQQLMQLAADYCNGYHKPLLSGDKRDDYFMEKLRKIRYRYFEKI